MMDKTCFTLPIESFLNKYREKIQTVDISNKMMKEICGVNSFFESECELKWFFSTQRVIDNTISEEIDRADYGDFQTNFNLAHNVTQLLRQKGFAPQIVIEPTCGRGNFIIAALNTFESIEEVIGIEIYKPYVWETKLSILDFFLTHPSRVKPEISIYHGSVFDFDFKQVAKMHSLANILAIGNPPWVTNAKLGSLNSSNLPTKSNFKNQSGLDAITGKGNFDIAEYITMMLLHSFQSHKGCLAFLVKNSVIKNLVFEQRNISYNINPIEKYSIDSKREFDVSVEASLLYCVFNDSPSHVCDEFDLYSQDMKNRFGWLDSSFVSDIAAYGRSGIIDGVCPIEWRQGIKHDCSSVMELERTGNRFSNNRTEEFILEEDLVYGFLKSSDLKNTVIRQTRKYIIVTQTKVGQETFYIKHLYPHTYAYLNKNIECFLNRKSSIYKGKPVFSIFGIGDYSFKPYKVAISGLYKTYHFTLVMPQNGKPVMLDDTCYFIGFDRLEYAAYTLVLLNTKIAGDFLRSITFTDAKRVFTKDILMRIDLYKLATLISDSELKREVSQLNQRYELSIDISAWNDYILQLEPMKEQQLSLFS